MANKTIAQLDTAQTLNDNMVIAVQDTNTTYKTTLADVKAYCGGDAPTLITKNITQNGTYNASSDNADGYSDVIVNVSGSGSSIGIPREVKNGVYQMPTTSITFSLPNDATDVSSYSLSDAFYGCTSITSVDFSSLTTVSGNYGL